MDPAVILVVHHTLLELFQICFHLFLCIKFFLIDSPLSTGVYVYLACHLDLSQAYFLEASKLS